MENIPPLKCACAHCGEVIEYTRETVGQTVTCPKCKEQSVLPDAPAFEDIPPPDREIQPARTCPVCRAVMSPRETVCVSCASKRRRKWSVIWGTVTALLLLGLGWLVLRAYNTRPSTYRVAAPTNTVIPPPPPPRGPKSMNDLRVGRFHVEQRRGSNFMVAVGDISNISDNLHGRIIVDVDVLDVRGVKIGTVSNFTTELRGQSVWHFVAPVPYTNAASVRFPGAIREDK